MEPLTEPRHTAWPFPFVPQDWEHTPAAVQAYVHTLQDELTRLRECVEALEARLKANSTTSHRPSSSDSPYKKPGQRTPASTPRKAGGKPGHAGHRQVLLPPTAVHDLRPERCPCGNTTFTAMRPYSIRTKCWSCPRSSWRSSTSCCIRGGVRSVASSTRRKCLPSMRRAMVHGSVRSWASWQGRTGMADAWYKPFVPPCCRCRSV